ncbi:Peptidoglycan-binding (PGRP) domain of peptidoglycan hydrolases-containing protein [Abditibacterium utsteinense]|uniref:Peptidoglycan-binding (PGRP) domain of peptidoglycan hydrolases-containing protein n=1 Tax=Abditibacterium utsteinense TaxID=1960156 RepID=A0A2S8SX04_9BACT|nr:peptidoglycan-binding domain-containing protein [Abditibacterium utsteinense]PQV65314.1 Peptidoglycan-binding (PGRP) domain of peptidoglycan hydrolases-containing protein [Abditibacterium utsteinense]
MRQLTTLFLAFIFAVPTMTPAKAQRQTQTQTKRQESTGKDGFVWPKVARGASGLRIVALQFLLRSRGYKVAADGKFGDATERALRGFQAKNRLQVDGTLGWQSWEALTPALKDGARGDAVRALQTLLIQAGYKLPRDGIYGSTSAKALAQFRKPLPITARNSTVYEIDWCYLLGGRVVPDAGSD